MCLKKFFNSCSHSTKKAESNEEQTEEQRVFFDKHFKTLYEKINRTDKNRFILDVRELSSLFEINELYDFIKKNEQKEFVVKYIIKNPSSKNPNIFINKPLIIEVQNTEENPNNKDIHKAFDKTVIPSLKEHFTSKNDKNAINIIEEAFKKREESVLKEKNLTF